MGPLQWPVTLALLAALWLAPRTVPQPPPTVTVEAPAQGCHCRCECPVRSLSGWDSISGGLATLLVAVEVVFLTAYWACCQCLRWRLEAEEGLHDARVGAARARSRSLRE